MRLKVFTFRFSESDDGFNDEPLQTFIMDKEVIEFTDHFFVHDKTPYLTVLLSYRELPQDERRRRDRSRDFRKDLDETEGEAFDSLRAWRAARARQEGIPPYMIVNNRQVAQIVRLRAQTKADLTKIDGIGEAKIARYGEEILEILDRHFGFAAADGSSTEERDEK